MMSVRSTALLGAALIGASGCSTLAEPLDPIEREKISIAKVALPAPGTTRMPGREEGWQLVWSDEFDGTRIDPAKWDFDVDCWGGGNDERQCYTDRPENARVADGRLIITAHKEDYTGPAWPPHMRNGDRDPNAQATKPFTSARMVTRGKAAWAYGRIEVRAKLPHGQGTWPAIWMLPEDQDYGTWAASGEIDILEAVNLGVACADCPSGREDTILGTLHFGGQWPDNALASTETHAASVLDGFHTFGIVWAPGRIDWTYDGQVYASQTNDKWWSSGSDAPDAPFDKRFHLLLNLAVGGKLSEERGQKGVDETGYPKQMEVDWVRVWQCPDAASSADACNKAR